MISGGLHANGCSLQGEYLKTIAIEYICGPRTFMVDIYMFDDFDDL